MFPSKQRCTNPGRQVAVETKFCTMAPNIFGSSVWNLFYVTLLEPIILKWENCAPLFSKYSLLVHISKRFVKYIFFNLACAAGDFALNMVIAVI